MALIFLLLQLLQTECPSASKARGEHITLSSQILLVYFGVLFNLSMKWLHSAGIYLFGPSSFEHATG